MNEDFLTLVKEMRYWQKQYFAQKQGTPGKKEALKESLYYERRVDESLQQMESGQNELGL